MPEWPVPCLTNYVRLPRLTAVSQLVRASGSPDSTGRTWLNPLLQAGWDVPPGPLGKLCQSAWGQERLAVLQQPLGKHACPRVLPKDGRRCSQCCGIRSSASCFGISVYTPHTLTPVPRPCHSLCFQGVVRERTNTIHAMLEAFGEKNNQ